MVLYLQYWDETGKNLKRFGIKHGKITKRPKDCELFSYFNTITHGPLRMERSHGQIATLPTKCVGTLAHSREIVPILRKPRGRQCT